MRANVARHQKLQHVAAVLDADTVLAQERRQLIDPQARVVRVPDVGEGVDASRAIHGMNSRSRLEMQLEAVGKL